MHGHFSGYSRVPFCFVASRWYLSHLLNRWSSSGRLARRVAVIGAGEFSREFIERLRSEPNLYTVVGLYDDRLSRIPAVQDGVKVRGSVRDLLERSREEQIDQIVIALPLSAMSRISMILEQIGSAVADLCLTTDFVGFRYRSSQISSVGSNPVVLIEERPLKDWRAAKKAAFDIVVGSSCSSSSRRCSRSLHWQSVSIARDRYYFASPVSVLIIGFLPATNSAPCIME